LQKELRYKLLRTASISAPLIAIYGASPFYIFEKITLKIYLLTTFALSINVFIVFAIYVFFTFQFPKQKKWVRFIVTYLVNSAIRIFFIVFDPLLNTPISFSKKYIAYPILTSIVLNAIVMIIVEAIVISYQKSKAEKLVQDLQMENITAQKQVLMQQLQPHFLFNALSVLKSLIGVAPATAANYVVQLSSFLRYTIQTGNNELVPIKNEISFVTDYIALQKTRFENAFDYEVRVDDDVLQKQVPVLAIQILVENIFKHNYFTEKNPLQFSITSNKGFILVKNNKLAVKQHQSLNTGLSNLSKRYQLIANTSIVIDNADFYFEVKIPIL
jgi:two-component system, LytTR family, sensor kinase